MITEEHFPIDIDNDNNTSDTLQRYKCRGHNSRSEIFLHSNNCPLNHPLVNADVHYHADHQQSSVTTICTATNYINDKFTTVSSTIYQPAADVDTKSDIFTALPIQTVTRLDLILWT